MDEATRSLFRWIDTLGGPHLLMPQEFVADWTGCDNWVDNGEDDPSDYARACRSGTSWLSPIPAPRCEIVVLGGDRGPIAWVPSSDVCGTLVQWIGFDSDQGVLGMLSNKELGKVEKLGTERCVFETGLSGRMVLFDASANGLQIEVDESEVLSLRPGRYSLAAYYVETDAYMAIVREISIVTPA